MPRKDVLVNVREIGGMVHLIPIEPGNVWYINNRIDPHTWNFLVITLRVQHGLQYNTHGICCMIIDDFNFVYSADC